MSVRYYKSENKVNAPRGGQTYLSRRRHCERTRATLDVIMLITRGREILLPVDLHLAASSTTTSSAGETGASELALLGRYLLARRDVLPLSEF